MGGAGGDVYDTDPPAARGGRLLGQPAAASVSASAFLPFGTSTGGTNRGMSFPGAASYYSAPGGGGGGVGVGDVDPRLKGAKKGGFKDWKRR